MNRLATLLGIQYPVIQGGMVWCSGWRLASAVSNAGGLGVIGAGSMHPEVFEDHLVKCMAATQKPFGVNLPLMYPQIEDMIGIVVRHKVPVVITSAGSPAKFTALFKDHGIKVLHVVSNLRFAQKSQQAGVDGVIAEGFEAGGHNGAEETTTLVLLQLLKGQLTVPLVAAGGIGSGSAMLAAMALGADGVQIGTLFASSEESSAHLAFKQRIVESAEGDTMLSLKLIGGVRLLRNPFFNRVRQLELAGGSPEQFQQLLGKGRAKKGMFEGDLEEGELEIGQVAATVRAIEPVSLIMSRLIAEFNTSRAALCQL